MPEKMNPEIKAEWLKRLRDPETKQTTGALCRTKPYVNHAGETAPVGMCCLGVLTEIAVERGIVERSTGPDIGLVGYEVSTSDGYAYTETGTLPEPVMEWAGLHEYNPSITTPEGYRTTVATYNDAGHTFAEIAEIIEAQF